MNNNIQNKKDIKEAIVNTIAFFDMFDFPLTSFEVWKYLSIKCELLDVMNELDIKNEKIESKNGFYFLKNKQDLYDIRMARYNVAFEKYKRALRVSKIFRFLPWLKMTAVGNVIGASNMKKESDIDLFIVTQKNRVWITRFFCVIIIIILRLRPKINNVADKICLSFFIDEEVCDFKKIMTNKDYYFNYWLANLIPIYNVNQAYQKIIKKNLWIYDCFPNWISTKTNMNRCVREILSEFQKQVLDLFMGGLDDILRKIQIKKMPSVLRKKMNKNTEVVVGKNIIKMHVNDRREYYNYKYQKIKI